MEIKGKIILVMPAQGGTSKAGNEWKKQDYVLETTDSQYPKKVCFNIFGADKIEQNKVEVGDDVLVSFDLESREFNGRWYTDVRAWRIEKVAADQMGQQSAPVPPVDFFINQDQSSNDDLPF